MTMSVCGVSTWTRRWWTTCDGLKEIAVRACGHRVRGSCVAPSYGQARVIPLRHIVLTAPCLRLAVAALSRRVCTRTAARPTRRATTSRVGVHFGCIDLGLALFK
jgi:hypothetical protein